jgi:hypothetical protein
MFSPARVSKSLAYPRANADNPAVPDRRSGLSKLPKKLCVVTSTDAYFLFSNEVKWRPFYSAFLVGDGLL